LPATARGGDLSDRFLSSRALEARLRVAHRRERQKSPELLREFKRNRKTGHSAFARSARHLLMPLFWAFVFYGTIQRQNDVRWAAGIVALWAAGTALKWGHEWFQQFYASDSLVVLNLLPL